MANEKTNEKNNDQDFNFFMPVELVKGKSNDEEDYKICGIASTEDLDQSGEIVRQSGLDVSLVHQNRLFFNDDHKPGVANLLGIVKKAKVESNKLYVEGYLFKDSEKAKAVYGVLKSLKKEDRGTIGFSIEGKILKRSGYDQKIISAARIDRIAITDRPVNAQAFCEIKKSFNIDTVELNNSSENMVIDYEKPTDTHDNSQSTVDSAPEVTNVTEDTKVEPVSENMVKSEEAIDPVELIQEAVAIIADKQAEPEITYKSELGKFLSEQLTDEQIDTLAEYLSDLKDIKI